MRKKLSVLPLCLVILLMLFLKPVPTAACSCAMLPSTEDGFSQSQAVFSGEVIGIKGNGGFGKTVVFKVKETWKGVNESEVVISTGANEAGCGISFVVGQEYLVFASLSDMYGDKSLTSTICDLTKELGNAANDLALLGQGQAPTHDPSPMDSGKAPIFIIGGIVFIVGLLVVFGWTKFKKGK